MPLVQKDMRRRTGLRLALSSPSWPLTEAPPSLELEPQIRGMSPGSVWERRSSEGSEVQQAATAQGLWMGS